MKVLGFDTATDDTVVAALDGDRPVFERCAPPAERPLHSQVLLEMVEAAAQRLGGWGRVERIAVGTGPGTFTGIRIGVATAAALSASTGIPAAGVSTLAALSRSAAAAGGEPETVMPLIDARRGEVFGALHDRSGRPRGEPFVCTPGELPARLRDLALRGPVPLVAGPGAVRFRGELTGAGIEIEPAGSGVHRLSGPPLCALAAVAGTVGPRTLEPLYLRIPDAQLWLERDGKTDHRTGPSAAG